jgi:hypothetical protein
LGDKQFGDGGETLFVFSCSGDTDSSKNATITFFRKSGVIQVACLTSNFQRRVQAARGGVDVGIDKQTLKGMKNTEVFLIYLFIYLFKVTQDR